MRRIFQRSAMSAERKRRCAVGPRGARGKRHPVRVEPLEGRELLSWAGSLAHFVARKSAALVARSTSTVHAGFHEVRDVVYSGDGQKLDLYIPNGPPPAGGRPAVVAFPGGGWEWASKTEYGSHVSALTSYGFVVAVADYTYATGAPGSRAWPIDFEDARNAVRWVRSHASRLHVDPNRIAAEGVSSGSYLANMLGVYPDGPVSGESLPPDAKGTGAPEGVSARVQAVVDFYGPTDIAALYNQEPRSRSHVVAFLGGTPDQFPSRYAAASPINFVSSDDPPFLILQGTADQAVPVAQSYELSGALANAGVPHRTVILDGITHGFEFRIGQVSLLPDVANFLDQALYHRPIDTKPSL